MLAGSLDQWPGQKTRECGKYATVQVYTEETIRTPEQEQQRFHFSAVQRAERQSRQSWASDHTGTEWRAALTRAELSEWSYRNRVEGSVNTGRVEWRTCERSRWEVYGVVRRERGWEVGSRSKSRGCGTEVSGKYPSVAGIICTIKYHKNNYSYFSPPKNESYFQWKTVEGKNL